ncbi:hypothetical protein ACS127_11265 [Amphibacillus sp. Q70]|uniref:hypothetical protein n=1 Tax=Amphibacillus sp. Q70 TaxID=3453416 RepID=UPI003F859D98
MNHEEKITSMFEQIMGKLDEHTGILTEHSQMLNEHSRILAEHSQILTEHSQILNALQAGQEYLKAEMDGMKIANDKEFKKLYSNQESFKIDIKLLKDQSWENKADIERIKNTMGMG